MAGLRAWQDGAGMEMTGWLRYEDFGWWGGETHARDACEGKIGPGQLGGQDMKYRPQ